ncbi:hypothetical protein, partial [Serratia marcescens]|uniref:hypothetical protein n=1 Tax=Serratia marcescens TaxID=615 RepID=UPI001C37C8FC
LIPTNVNFDDSGFHDTAPSATAISIFIATLPIAAPQLFMPYLTTVVSISNFHLVSLSRALTPSTSKAGLMVSKTTH